METSGRLLCALDVRAEDVDRVAAALGVEAAPFDLADAREIDRACLLMGKVHADRIAIAFQRGYRRIVEYLPEWTYRSGMAVEAVTEGSGAVVDLCLSTAAAYHLPLSEAVTQRAVALAGAARRWDIELAVTEALSNSLIHGNLGVTSDMKTLRDFDRFLGLIEQRLNDPHYASRAVRTSIHLREQRVTIRVQDEGSGYVAASIEDHGADEPTGRGLALIRRVVDELLVTDSGRCVDMSFKVV